MLKYNIYNMEIFDKLGLYKIADTIHRAIVTSSESSSDLKIALKMQLIQLKNYMSGINIQDITKDPKKFYYDSNIENIIDLINRIDQSEKQKPDPNRFIV